MGRVVDKDFIVKYIYDLGGLVAVDYEESDELIKIWVVDKPVAQVCPVCGKVMWQDSTRTFIAIEDVPIHGKQVQLLLSRRREIFGCECGKSIGVTYTFKYLFDYYNIASTDRYIEYLDECCGYAVYTGHIVDAIGNIDTAIFDIMEVVRSLTLRDTCDVKIRSIADKLIELVNYIITRYVKMDMPIEVKDRNTRKFIQDIISSSDPIEYLINCFRIYEHRDIAYGIDMLAKLEKLDDVDKTMSNLRGSGRLYNNKYENALNIAYAKYKMCKYLKSCHINSNGLYEFDAHSRFHNGYEAYMNRINSIEIKDVYAECKLDVTDIQLFNLFRHKGMAVRYFNICGGVRCVVLSDCSVEAAGWDSTWMNIGKYYVMAYGLTLCGYSYYFYYLPKLYSNGEGFAYNELRLRKVLIHRADRLNLYFYLRRISGNLNVQSGYRNELKHTSKIRELAVAYVNTHCTLLKCISISVYENSINISATHYFSDIIVGVKTQDKEYMLCDIYGMSLIVKVRDGAIFNNDSMGYVGLPLNYSFDQGELKSFMNILGSEFKYISHEVIEGIYHIKVSDISSGAKCVKCGGDNLSYVTQSLSIKTVTPNWIPVEFEVVNYKIYRCNDDGTIFKLRYPFKELDSIGSIKI